MNRGCGKFLPPERAPAQKEPPAGGSLEGTVDAVAERDAQGRKAVGEVVRGLAENGGRHALVVLHGQGEHDGGSFPGVEVSAMVPPMAAMESRAIVRPRPLPEKGRPPWS